MPQRTPAAARARLLDRAGTVGQVGVEERVATFATHAHLGAVCAAVAGEDRRAPRLGAASGVKGGVRLADPGDRLALPGGPGLEAIRGLVGLKATRHPIGS